MQYIMSFTQENLHTLWILFSVESIQFLEETLHLNTSDSELPGNPRNTFFFIFITFFRTISLHHK